MLLHLFRLPGDAGGSATDPSNPAGTTPAGGAAPASGEGPPLEPVEGPPWPGSTSQKTAPADPGKTQAGEPTSQPGAKPTSPEGGEGGQEPGTTPASDLAASKYTSPEALAQGYNNLNSEFAKLKAENAQMRTQVQAQPAFQPGQPQPPPAPTNGQQATAPLLDPKLVSATLKQLSPGLGEDDAKAIVTLFQAQEKSIIDRFAQSEASQQELVEEQQLNQAVEQFYVANPVAAENRPAIQKELAIAKSRANDIGYYCELMLAKVQADAMPEIIEAAVKAERKRLGHGGAPGQPTAEGLVAGQSGGGAPAEVDPGYAAVFERQMGVKPR